MGEWWKYHEYPGLGVPAGVRSLSDVRVAFENPPKGTATMIQRGGVLQWMLHLQCDAMASLPAHKPKGSCLPAAPLRGPMFLVPRHWVMCPVCRAVTRGNPSKGRPILRTSHLTRSTGRLEVVGMGCGD